MVEFVDVDHAGAQFIEASKLNHERANPGGLGVGGEVLPSDGIMEILNSLTGKG